jgi:hypothetical protein
VLFRAHRTRISARYECADGTSAWIVQVLAKAAPDFKYASSTLADTDMRPAGGADVKKTTP